MILTAHQPSYLPWLGLFSKINLSDRFVYLDTVQYSKWDWSSRNKIRTPEGWLWLTVPVLSGGKHGQKFTEVKIDNTQKWNKKHLKAIKMSYSRAPYFDLYYNFFEEVFEQEWIYLSKLNEFILLNLIKILGINTKFVKASESLKLEGEKSELVLDMCIKMNADEFIFGGEGQDYANVEDFKSKGIKVWFQDYQYYKYKQIHGDHISNLSIIDLLFNHGPNSLEIIMKGQKLI